MAMMNVILSDSWHHKAICEKIGCLDFRPGHRSLLLTGQAATVFHIVYSDLRHLLLLRLVDP
jgi:hypothetical protein